MTPTIIMKGMPVAKKLLTLDKEDKELLANKKVCIFTNEEDPASAIYVRNKRKKFEEVGIKCDVVTTNNLSFAEVQELTRSFQTDGIPYMFQLPMAAHFTAEEQENLVNQTTPFLDLDSMSCFVQGSFYNKPSLDNSPCTPYGIILMLKHYLNEEEDLLNKNVVVIGRSGIVGRPMARLMEYFFDATVTICHSKTKNIKDITRRADIIVCAVGKANFLTADMIKDGAIIVDVGINRNENGVVVGDVKTSLELMEKVKAITPVPGGVGPMTVGTLVYKTIEKFKKEENR